jgi:alkylhydroperoxidase family enzyme
LRSLGGIDDALKDQLVTDYNTADISEQDKLILEYAEKITRDAASITQDYIDELKRHDMPDRMLHDIVQVASYFAYVNRLADGLGVEVEGR